MVERVTARFSNWDGISLSTSLSRVISLGMEEVDLREDFLARGACLRAQTCAIRGNGLPNSHAVQGREEV